MNIRCTKCNKDSGISWEDDKDPEDWDLLGDYFFCPSCSREVTEQAYNNKRTYTILKD